MDGTNPVHHRLVLGLGLEGLHLLCHVGFGLYQVYLCQKAIRVQYLLHMRAQLVGEHSQYAHYFATLGSLQFTYLVVGFHYLGRFDENRLARG